MHEYFEMVRSSERNAACDTDDAFAKDSLGIRAPAMASLLSKAVESLAQMASCAWGCRGKDHTIENLLRRLVNLALGARNLAWAGYYDEALLLIRSGAEVTNLLQLFSVQPDREPAWRAAPESKDFTPIRVRLAIEAAGSSPFVHKDRYGALCKVAAHATHDFALTAHEPTEKPITRVGPWFAVPGVLLVLGEILAIVQPCLTVAGGLTQQSTDRQEALNHLAMELEALRPPITIENYRQSLAFVAAAAQQGDAPDGAARRR